MTWWHARWLGVLIGLAGGAVIGLLIVAWRISTPLGLIATVLAVILSLWLCRFSPVHVIGRRTSLWLDRPALRGEHGVFFVCGFVVGAVLSFLGAARHCETLPALVLVTVAPATLCGVLSMVLGDRFWSRY